MLRLAALMQRVSAISARSTSSIPPPDPTPHETYSLLGIGLFVVLLFVILVAGTVLICYKDRCSHRKRKWDARFRQDTHLARATDVQWDLERGHMEKDYDGFKNIPLNDLERPSKAHISADPSRLTWVRFLVAKVPT